jgi:uncharacterized damage-inducible protein DinB
MKQNILNYARYNLWANTGLVELFQQQPDALIEQPVISSFPSIRETLLHLWSVEVVWMDRLKGISPADFPAKTFTGSNAELYDNLLASSRNLIELVESSAEQFFVTPIEFTFLASPDTQRQIPQDIFHHLFNHQTMHRGQLITMGRQLGITAFPRTDYIIWVRDQAAGSEG